MSVKVRSVNVNINPYIIRLGYIRKIHPKVLDVWTYRTHEPDYVLNLPSHMLHSQPFYTSVNLLPLSHYAFTVYNLRSLKIGIIVRRKRMLKIYKRRYKSLLLPIKVNSLDVTLRFLVHVIVGFYGIPIKRRGIPGEEVMPSVRTALRVLITKRRIKGPVKLKYYFPNVIIAPSGKIKYLGHGILLVIPSRGLKIPLDIYVIEDKNGNQHVLVEVKK